MATLEHGALKIATAKTLGMALPIGMIALAAAWAWRGRERRSATAPATGVGGTWVQGEAGAQRTTATRATAADSANSGHRGSTEYKRSGAVSSFAGSAGQEALLSRVIEDNVRLRASLKQH